MKLLVYSHDAFGLGNIRRMLAICQHLLQENSNLSILVLSGSPALHSLRLPSGLGLHKVTLHQSQYKRKSGRPILRRIP